MPLPSTNNFTGSTLLQNKTSASLSSDKAAEEDAEWRERQRLSAALQEALCMPAISPTARCADTGRALLGAEPKAHTRRHQKLVELICELWDGFLSKRNAKPTAAPTVPSSPVLF